jgi:WD40-like Beta Propeller Repeat
VRRLLILVPSILLASVYACVGDDPSTGPPATGAEAGTDSPTDSTSPPSDGPSNVDSGGDAGVDAGACNPAAAFGAPVALDALNTGNPEDGLTLSADELTIYFASLGTLKQATRTSKDMPFANVSTVAVADQPETHEMFLTHDGQVLYTSVGAGAPAFYLSTFGAGGFAAPIAVSGSVGAMFNGSDPFLNRQKSTAYFSFPTPPDGGGVPKAALFKTTIFMPSAWGQATLITELWSSQGDRHPVVSQDEKTMFFASRRQSTQYDIWVTQRGSIAVQWGTPTKVDALSTTEDDYPGWLSDDGCRMYLLSHSSGNFDIYVAKRGL